MKKGSKHTEETKAKIAIAMLNNSNAEDWTLEMAEDYVLKVEQYVIENKDCRHIGEAANKCGGYEDLHGYLQRKFKTEFRPIKNALSIIKTRLINAGLEEDVNVTMAIFILKTNHGMVETSVNKIITEQPLFPD